MSNLIDGRTPLEVLKLQKGHLDTPQKELSLDEKLALYAILHKLNQVYHTDERSVFCPAIHEIMTELVDEFEAWHETQIMCRMMPFNEKLKMTIGVMRRVWRDVWPYTGLRGVARVLVPDMKTIWR